MNEMIRYIIFWKKSCRLVKIGENKKPQIPTNLLTLIFLRGIRALQLPVGTSDLRPQFFKVFQFLGTCGNHIKHQIS